MPPGPNLVVLRKRAERFLPDTCSIQRSTATPDSTGGQTLVWATVVTAVRCRVLPSSGDEQELAERTATQSSWTVTMPALTDVRQADRIIYSGRTFEVSMVLGGHSWEVGCRVLATETT